MRCPVVVDLPESTCPITEASRQPHPRRSFSAIALTDDVNVKLVFSHFFEFCKKSSGQRPDPEEAAAPPGITRPIALAPPGGDREYRTHLMQVGVAEEVGNLFFARHLFKFLIDTDYLSLGKSRDLIACSQ